MQTTSRLVRWRVVILGFMLATLIAIVITAVYQNRQFMAGWAAFQSGDYATALLVWRPLAEHGHVKAQHNIGSMYLKGEGVPKDNTEGEKWTRKAAEQGRAIAQYNLGLIYANGQGGRRDYAEAVKWYRMAAKQNLAHAQTDLGILHLWGRGVPQDNEKAHMWGILAARQGSKHATKLRDDSAKRLTSAQIAEVEKLVREWTEEHGQSNAVQRSIATAIQAAAVAADTILAPIIALAPTLTSAPTIVGEWQSTPVLGQLGLGQTTVTFNEDRSFTMKVDFISFAQIKPDLEYFWGIFNGTYSVVGDKVTLDFDKTWFVRKMRGKDEAKGAPEPVRGKARRQVAHWKDGKLMMKDVVLERVK